MEPVHVAFLWHQHQPLYKDPATDRYVLPWVRLHAIKDYIGLLLVLKEFPEIRATVNLVPSLIQQIQEYAEGRAEDDALLLTRKPAGELSEQDRIYMLEHFFSTSPERLIHPFERYNELFKMRRAEEVSAEQALPAFTPDDLRDLQVWATLAWFHPLVVESDSVLGELRNKARAFTEEDKAAMLERQNAVVGRVLPLHRELAETGQIEISTTPFYHPILPLLCNMESAREAMPNVPMPQHRADLAPDAETQITRAIELHESLFGAPPTGLWPAEGSVSMDIIPLLSNRGLKWIATDEGILGRSLDTQFPRGQDGILESPDVLYQPYRLPGDGGAPAIVFRDHGLSDAIGFEYHHWQLSDAVDNLIWRLNESGRKCQGRPRLISIILDGENPWDYYDQAGLPFLREFYGRLAREKDIRTTRLSDFMEEHPAQEQLPRLAAGSWIDADFHIWVGSKEDRAAWTHTARARDAVARKARENPQDCPTLDQAWEAVLAAEGSDWYWWFGSDRTSKEDALFDALFRSYLKAAYRFIGEEPPVALDEPVGASYADASRSQPTGPLRVTIDGRVTGEAEWAGAGACVVPTEGGAMRRSGAEQIRTLYYGFCDGAFVLRLDADGPLRERLDDGVQVALQFAAPATVRLLHDKLNQAQPEISVLDENGQPRQTLDSLALGDVLESAIPLSLLAAEPGNEIQFSLELIKDGECIQRVPRDGVVRAIVPEPGEVAQTGA